MSENIYRATIQIPHDRVIVALDGISWREAGEISNEVGEYVGMAKANSLAQRPGWDATVSYFGDRALQTMADPKYKDIPKTMKNHLIEITSSQPRLVTVFADNTEEALVASVEGRDEVRKNLLESAVDDEEEDAAKTTAGILGVTVLTSFDGENCVSIYGDTPEKKVLQFAHTAAEAGLDGIVCSGEELIAIRKDSALDNLITVVPGITPEWARKAGDQKRVVTPTEAVQSGADFIVVGRAIVDPEEISRREAAQRIAEELKEAL